ncbi:hypothetical protein MM438_13385 [Arsenicicoccus dermatophilus]|nr:hypothetical protein [Arsenicicoccus dermatophilus]MCH8613995.1 hypothetical protein [Arsenicicoccus dermatophilus]
MRASSRRGCAAYRLHDVEVSTVPACGARIPATVRSRVDLPHPLLAEQVTT